MRLATAIAMTAAVIGGATLTRGQVSEQPYPWRTAEVTDEEFRVPVREDMAGRIASAVQQLGSPLYGEREDAGKLLMTIGSPAFTQLRQAYAETDSLEVRLRIEDIVHEAYLNYHVFDRNAFLGISQNRVPQNHDDDPRIKEGHYGVTIAKIIPNTAAQDVDLKKGDVIIALDGEALQAVGGNINLTFGESVRVRGPGALVTLSVLRGDAEFDVEVTLGRRPKEYYARQGVVTDMLQTIDQNFGIWWVKYFRETPSENVSDK